MYSYLKLTLFFYLIVQTVSDVNEPVLELVHVFFRHGSRTPEKFEIYPNDPLAIGNFNPLGFGQLTNIGKRRAFDLGKLLRKRYTTFLGESYFPDMVSVQTTEYIRTQMSALLVLAGLFPPSTSQKWNSDLDWMPIPYSYEKKDYLLRRPQKYCPALDKEINSILESKNAHNLLAEHKNDYIYISQHLGRNISRLIDSLFLYQALKAEEQMNLPLPVWTHSIYPTTVHTLAVNFLAYQSASPLAKRLNGGRVVKKVIENMVAKAKNVMKPEGRKMFLYSGHEVNIISILSVLGLFDMKFPDFSSAVMIELYSDSSPNKYVVKVVYAGDPYSQPEELTIPDCSKFCPLNQLMEKVDKYLPNNYTEECGSQIPLD